MDQAFLLFHEYLMTENRILRNQIQRPMVKQDVVAVIRRLAQANRSWGDDRMAGAMAH